MKNIILKAANVSNISSNITTNKNNQNTVNKEIIDHFILNTKGYCYQR